MWGILLITVTVLFSGIQAQFNYSSPTSIVNRVEDIQLTIPAPSDDLNVYAMPVGQGDCTIIQCPTNGNIAVVDCGSSGGKNRRLSSAQVQHYLSPQIDRVSTIIITHPDIDHFNYLYEIWRDTKTINTVIIGGNLSNYNRPSSDFTKIYNWLSDFNGMGKLFTVSGGLPCIGNCVVPTGILNFCHNQNIQFNILAANVGRSSRNQLSIVMKVAVGQWSMLLPGDIEGKAARQIATSLGSQLQSTVYKMAHHGAKQLANSPTWLEAIRPRSTFTSSAYNYTYHHPHCETIRRIENLGTIDQRAPKHTFYCGNGDKTAPTQYPAFTQSMFQTSPSPDKICMLTYSSSYHITNQCTRISYPRAGVLHRVSMMKNVLRILWLKRGITQEIREGQYQQQRKTTW